jgi:hypothetical protein
VTKTSTKSTATRTRKARKVKAAAQLTDKAQTKQNVVLAMLRRQNGASIAEIIAATSWQPHSVRGFFSGALKRRLKINVVSEKDTKTGERRYHIAAL